MNTFWLVLGVATLTFNGMTLYRRGLDAIGAAVASVAIALCGALITLALRGLTGGHW